ncbi:MAG: twin-arginine translocation pathway signal precursor [Hyphomicrobiales bacterium]|nr:twin-arginine translocation pathway signal precursor [Hyphomicrobiales bacterium]
MQFTRRHVLAGSIAAPAILTFGGARAATMLKISHQFPGSTGKDGDFRDQLCRKFAEDIAKKSNGDVEAQVYAGSSLMKVNSQVSSMRKGALDMSLVPISYAGGEMPEVNIGLMPALVSSYAQGLAWKKAAIGQEFTKFLDDKGIMIVTWLWQAGGVASRATPLVNPEDAKGMKIRGGSREMDLMLQAAGAAVLSLPSNELYAAMQTGACDAGYTSSTSLISFRLEEIAKHLTTGRGKSYWYMLEPLMISKAIFAAMPKKQQDLVMEVGEGLEAYGRDAAMADDELVAKIYEKAGAKIHDLDDSVVEKWRVIARDTAWKDYAAKNANCAKLLKLAEAVPA